MYYAYVVMVYDFINPWRMHEGLGSHSVCVCVCVCLSITVLAATYLVCKSQERCYKIPYGVSNVCISLKMLCSPVLASFAYNHCLPCSLTNS